MDNIKPVAPNVEGMSPDAAAKATAEYQTANDQYMANILGKSAGALSPEERDSLGREIGSFVRGLRQ